MLIVNSRKRQGELETNNVCSLSFLLILGFMYFSLYSLHNKKTTTIYSEKWEDRKYEPLGCPMAIPRV